MSSQKNELFKLSYPDIFIAVFPQANPINSNNDKYPCISKSNHHPTNKKPHECGGLKNHYQSNRLNKSANPKTPMNTLSPLKPFVIDKTIAIPTDNKPIILQGFNVFNFSNHLISKFNDNLSNRFSCLTFA